MSSGSPVECKVVLLGDTGCGKSSIVLRFVTGTWERYNESTIGASFLSKMIQVDAKPIKFQIWDTAGQGVYCVSCAVRAWTGLRAERVRRQRHDRQETRGWRAGSATTGLD